MDGLTGAETRLLMSCLLDLYELQDVTAFGRRLSEIVLRLAPADACAYNEVDLAAGTAVVLEHPVDGVTLALKAVFEQHLDDHPVIRYQQTTRDGSPRTISDFLSQRQFHETGIYQELFRLMGVEEQIAFGLPSPPPLVIGVAANRGAGRRFSDRERYLLSLLRPHAVRAYENALWTSRVSGALNGAAHLTAREREVLQLVSEGCTDREVAGQLRLSPRTVHKHLENIYRKLGVSTRTGAVRLAGGPLSL